MGDGALVPQINETFERYARARPFFGLRHGTADFVRRALAGAGGTYFEAGAGDGRHAREMIDAGMLRAYDGIVLSDVSQRRAAEIARTVSEARTLVCSADDLPLPGASIDFFYADQVIEHVPDDASMAAEIARVLRPGGRGVVGSVIKGAGAWYFRRNGGEWRLDATHVREYASIDRFETVFTRAGLEIEESLTVPLAFDVRDLLTRLAIVARVVHPHRAASLRARLPSLRVPIPRYALCYVRIVKPAALT